MCVILPFYMFQYQANAASKQKDETKNEHAKNARALNYWRLLCACSGYRYFAIKLTLYVYLLVNNSSFRSQTPSTRTKLYYFADFAHCGTKLEGDFCV